MLGDNHMDSVQQTDLYRSAGTRSAVQASETSVQIYRFTNLQIYKFTNLLHMQAWFKLRVPIWYIFSLQCMKKCRNHKYVCYLPCSLRQGDRQHEKAPLGNNLRPRQPLRGRTLRTNIAIPAQKVREKKPFSTDFVEQRVLQEGDVHRWRRCLHL